MATHSWVQKKDISVCENCGALNGSRWGDLPCCVQPEFKVRHGYPDDQTEKTRKKILKEFNSNYYTHQKKGNLYEVFGVVMDKDIDEVKVMYREIMQVRMYHPVVGEYMKLKADRYAVYSRSVSEFKKKMKPIKDKKEKFELAHLIESRGE